MKTPQQQRGRCLTSLGRLGGGKHASPHAPWELKSSLNWIFPFQQDHRAHPENTLQKKASAEPQGCQSPSSGEFGGDNKDVSRRSWPFLQQESQPTSYSWWGNLQINPQEQRCFCHIFWSFQLSGHSIFCPEIQPAFELLSFSCSINLINVRVILTANSRYFLKPCQIHAKGCSVSSGVTFRLSLIASRQPTTTPISSIKWQANLHISVIYSKNTSYLIAQQHPHVSNGHKHPGSAPSATGYHGKIPTSFDGPAPHSL